MQEMQMFEEERRNVSANQCAFAKRVHVNENLLQPVMLVVGVRDSVPTDFQC
jgi:hypothetical protein